MNLTERVLEELMSGPKFTFELYEKFDGHSERVIYDCLGKLKCKLLPIRRYKCLIKHVNRRQYLILFYLERHRFEAVLKMIRYQSKHGKVRWQDFGGMINHRVSDNDRKKILENKDDDEYVLNILRGGVHGKMS